MRKIILTAVDNNHHFWFDHLVPFLLSLAQTDYKGDVGVISYGLSERKKQILINNGCLVFNAPHKYKTVYIDRQWAAAEIAKQYDVVALYDTDIWFPHRQLELFSEIQSTNQLYCVYEAAYGDFIENCVNKSYQAKIRQIMQQHLYKHKRLWQVGVVAGQQAAWLQYQCYLEQALTKEHIFTQEYGIDSLLMSLYSVQYDGVCELPEKYNCTPDCGGVRFSNLTMQGEILPKSIFTIRDEPIQGLHVTGPFRLWERNFYEYLYHHGIHYFSEGRKYCLKNAEMKAFKVDKFNQALSQVNFPLRVDKINAEQPVMLHIKTEDILFTVGGKTHIFLHNPHSYALTLQYAVQAVLDSRLVKGRFVAYNNKTPSVYKLNQWHNVSIPANAEVILACYDIDSEAKMLWRLKRNDKYSLLNSK